jgi:hypothetical protein
VLDHLDDLESDFSAIHRIDDIYSMRSRKFFTFAKRIAAYQGAMAARVAEEVMQQREHAKARQNVANQRQRLATAGAQVSSVSISEPSYLDEMKRKEFGLRK